MGKYPVATATTTSAMPLASAATRQIQRLTEAALNMSIPKHTLVPQAWVNRSSILRSYTTPKYQQTQSRFAHLITLTPEQRAAQFIQMTAKVLPSTRETYFGALLGAMKLLDVPMTPEDRVVQKALAAEAKVHVPNIMHCWTHQAQQTVNLLAHKSPEATLLMILAYTLAQRPHDVLLLKRRSVKVIGGNVAVFFVDGKVIPMTQPYWLHIPLSLPLSDLLLSWVSSSTHELLFPTGPTLLDLISATLKSVHPELQLRSLRRGALSTMALNGATAEELLHYSRHRNVQTLQRYLGWDLYDTFMPDQCARLLQKLNVR